MAAPSTTCAVQQLHAALSLRSTTLRKTHEGVGGALGTSQRAWGAAGVASGRCAQEGPPNGSVASAA